MAKNKPSGGEVEILYLSSSATIFLPFDKETSDDIEAVQVTTKGRKGIFLFSKSKTPLNVALCKGNKKTTPWEIPILPGKANPCEKKAPAKPRKSSKPAKK
jgi:hypothetical protein